MEVVRIGKQKDAAPYFSIVMLFKDDKRWNHFSGCRFADMVALDRACPFKFEAVFVINGFSDKTQFIRDAEGLPFPATFIFHGINHIPKARNLAVREARGTHILIWDDDDAPLDVNGVTRLLKEYGSLHIGVLCAELRNRAGDNFHPQAPDIMPQQWHPSAQRLLLTGMQHTPLIVRRSIALAFPLSEIRELRGEWVDWSTRLWRAGLPIGYVPGTCVFQDQNGTGESATRCAQALVHVLVSLLCSAYEYDLKPGTFPADLMYRRYAERELGAHFSDPVGVWESLLHAGRNLQCPSCASDSEGPAEKAMLSAWQRVAENLPQLRAGKAGIERETVYPMPPFGLFEPSNRTMFEECVGMAPKRLERYVSL